MNQLSNLEHYLRKETYFLEVLSVALVVLIGFYDYWVGSEVSVTLFYLLPILISAWFGKKWSGYGIALASVAACAIANWHFQEYLSVGLLFWNIAMRTVIFLFFAYFIIQIKRKVLELNLDSALAPRIDPLTKIFNSRTFYEIVETEMKKLQRYKRPIAIAYMDINNFKTINNTFGNTTGDHLLFTVAQEMSKNIRASDVIARIGGDEFVFLMPEAEINGVRVFVAKIQGILAKTAEENGWPVTFSFGATLFLKPPYNVNEMIKIPEDQMRLAKNAENNSAQYSVYE